MARECRCIAKRGGIPSPPLEAYHCPDLLHGCISPGRRRSAKPRTGGLFIAPAVTTPLFVFCFSAAPLGSWNSPVRLCRAAEKQKTNRRTGCTSINRPPLRGLDLDSSRLLNQVRLGNTVPDVGNDEPFGREQGEGIWELQLNRYGLMRCCSVAPSRPAEPHQEHHRREQHA